jgi:hypothetical protein
MRSTIAISAVAASLFTSAFAANCNPSYNVPGSGECYTNCNIVSKPIGENNFVTDSMSFIESWSKVCAWLDNGSHF